MSQDERYLIGIDVGGTKIAGGIVAISTGAVSAHQSILTQPQRGGEAVLSDVERMAATLVAYGRRHGLEIAGLGLGVPELVDLHGNVMSAYTQAWIGMPVAARLAALLPTTVESDVRAAALAEAVFGAGRGLRYFIYVTVGTGISHSLVIDGRPYTGAHGLAITFASAPITLDCPHCGRRHELVLEAHAAGPGLVRRYNEVVGTALQDGQEVTRRSATGDLIAQAIVRSAGEALGVGIAWLINTLDPEAVVIGGGLGLAGGEYWEYCVGAVYTHIYAEQWRDLPLLPAQLRMDAGIVGAALAAHRQA